MSIRYRLCRATDLEDETARGFEVGQGRSRVLVFVGRHDGTLFAYENRCPHIGTPLDLTPDWFFTVDGRYLLCATHGAMFEPIGGLCVRGPCRGDRLRSVPFGVDADGMVWVAP